MAVDNPSQGDAVLVDDIDEKAEVLPFRYSITSYGADYPVDGLVKRLQDEDIVIPTFDPEVGTESGVAGFQRGFVWTRPQMDKFIESLLLGLPVPGIFLVKDVTGKLLVLDGQQRLRTVQSFYDGVVRGKEYRLESVQGAFLGKRYVDLDDADRRRLDDSIIHATIVRQDEPSGDQSSIYEIFERLNTGGTELQPQEIRVALYRGSFVSLLRRLNEVPAWRKLYGQKSKSLKDQELILRFFAMLESEKDYRRPMKEFLNEYMSRRREITDKDASELSATFERTVAAIDAGIGARAFRLKAAVNAAVLDSVMVGVANRLRQGPITDPSSLADAYSELLRSDEYLGAVQRATADEESVRARLALAKAAFATAK
jgi:hypothetical protein